MTINSADEKSYIRNFLEVLHVKGSLHIKGCKISSIFLEGGSGHPGTPSGYTLAPPPQFHRPCIILGDNSVDETKQFHDPISSVVELG